jgi:sigma-54 specific flagellar transcriptional regulator A
MISGADLRRSTETSPVSFAPSAATPTVTTSHASDAYAPIDLKNMLETLELERIQMALDMADGVISEAARMLTLKRTTLIEKMRKYGVDRTC